LTQAACGGLQPAPVSRLREVCFPYRSGISHLLRRFLRHTDASQPADFEAWLAYTLKRRRKPKKARTDDPPAQKDAPTPEELAERQRRRKATPNRVINAFKACVNHAHAAGKVPSRAAWARLKKFRWADSARLRWFAIQEVRRLQNASAPHIRSLVSAALFTGCRADELLCLIAGDFDRRSRTLLIADSKSGKPRHVPLTDDGVALVEDLTAGKPENECLFSRTDGSAWYRMPVVRAIRAACEGGKIKPIATFHTLRHTYVSHLVQRFGSINDARAHCREFFQWYNSVHRCSGIGYMTPHAIHHGGGHRAQPAVR